MRFILSFLALIFTVSSLQASELTAFSKSRISTLWNKKDYRAAAFYISSELQKQNSSSNKEPLISALKTTYLKAGAPQKAKELEQTVINKKTFDEFIENEIAVTEPSIILRKTQNGDLVTGSIPSSKMAEKGFQLPPNLGRVKKDSEYYNNILKRFWWFTPN